MPTDPSKVLILCTGNSCRSIMAEALINQLGQGLFRAWSAGSAPSGYVHPYAIATLVRYGIDPGRPYSKSWNEFVGRPFDCVITVCDQAAGESCPIFPGRPTPLHWSIPDPAQVHGSEADIEAAFNGVLFLLKEHIEKLLHSVRLQHILKCAGSHEGRS
ncbi:MAG: arsenate reductase ArsC [Nitrospirae bacterium]|nr:arsenate reductase ArsC [Nitrospirota bacterium]